MNIIILGGFLGSGKTTALLQLARHLVSVSQSDSDQKVIIIENEIGEVGVDEGYMFGSGTQVENLFSGCACCTLAGELIATLTRLQRDFAPEWIIIETTGVAMPGSVKASILSAMGIESRVIVLTDAQRWPRIYRAMGHLLRDQIRGADGILINKCDAADGEAIKAVEADIRAQSGNIPLFRVSAARGIDAAVWDAALSREG